MNDHQRPLQGRRILVTRGKAQADALASGLQELGARVLELPAIEVEPPLDTTSLDDCLRRLARYDWLLFTSANAVRFTCARLQALGLRLEQAPAIATVGSATTEALRASFPGRATSLEPTIDFRG